MVHPSNKSNLKLNNLAAFNGNQDIGGGASRVVDKLSLFSKRSGISIRSRRQNSNIGAKLNKTGDIGDKNGVDVI